MIGLYHRPAGTVHLLDLVSGQYFAKEEMHDARLVAVKRS